MVFYLHRVRIEQLSVPSPSRLTSGKLSQEIGPGVAYPGPAQMVLKMY